VHDDLGVAEEKATRASGVGLNGKPATDINACKGVSTRIQ